jgi:elongation factor Tu
MLFKLFHKNDDDIIKDPIKVGPKAEQPIFKREEGPRSVSDGSGEMTIDDVFSIKGRGIVVTGRVKGQIRLNQNVVIEKTDGSSLQSVITGIEAFHKTLDLAMDGDNCGLLLRGIERNQVERGDVVKTA